MGLTLQVSEHSSKIEKAQKELESAIEAAKTETQAALDKRMNNAKENKDVQLEVRFFLEPATTYLIEFLL